MKNERFFWVWTLFERFGIIYVQNTPQMSNFWTFWCRNITYYISKWFPLTQTKPATCLPKMTKNNTLQVVFLSDDLRSPLRIQCCLWTGHRWALFGRNTYYDRCIDQMLLCVRSGCNIENQPWFGHDVSFCFSDSKCIMYDAELVLYFSLNSCDSLL